MAKYHIKKDGTPGICTAQHSCPLGGADEHFSSAEEAQNYADKKNKADAAGSDSAKEKVLLSGLSNLERGDYADELLDKIAHENGYEDFRDMSSDGEMWLSIDGNEDCGVEYPYYPDDVDTIDIIHEKTTYRFKYNDYSRRIEFESKTEPTPEQHPEPVKTPDIKSQHERAQKAWSYYDNDTKEIHKLFEEGYFKSPRIKYTKKDSYPESPNPKNIEYFDGRAFLNEEEASKYYKNLDYSNVQYIDKDDPETYRADLEEFYQLEYSEERKEELWNLYRFGLSKNLENGAIDNGSIKLLGDNKLIVKFDG